MREINQTLGFRSAVKNCKHSTRDTRPYGTLLAEHLGGEVEGIKTCVELSSARTIAKENHRSITGRKRMFVALKNLLPLGILVAIICVSDCTGHDEG